ncbi:MAG: hypothetical protein WCI72_05800 [archaeon]
MGSDLSDVCMELLSEGVSYHELGEIAKRTNVSLFGSVPGTFRYDLSAFIEGAVKTAACVGVGFFVGGFLGGAFYEIMKPEVSKTVCELVGAGLVSSALLFEGLEYNADASSLGSRVYNQDLMGRVLREKYHSILGEEDFEEEVVESKSD